MEFKIKLLSRNKKIAIFYILSGAITPVQIKT